MGPSVAGPGAGAGTDLYYKKIKASERKGEPPGLIEVGTRGGI